MPVSKTESPSPPDEKPPAKISDLTTDDFILLGFSAGLVLAVLGCGVMAIKLILGHP